MSRRPDERAPSPQLYVGYLPVAAEEQSRIRSELRDKAVELAPKGRFTLKAMHPERDEGVKAAYIAMLDRAETLLVRQDQ